MHRWEGEERSERSCSASSEQSNNQFNPAFALLLAALRSTGLRGHFSNPKGHFHGLNRSRDRFLGLILKRSFPLYFQLYIVELE